MNTVEHAPPVYERSTIRRHQLANSGTIEHVPRDQDDKGRDVPQGQSWQPTNRHIHHLAARLERLQASLDVLGHQPPGNAQAVDRPTTGGGSSGAMLMGILLFLLGVAGGIFYRSAPQSDLQTVWQQLPANPPDRVVGLDRHPVPSPAKPVVMETPMPTARQTTEEPSFLPSPSDAKVMPAQAVEIAAPVALPPSPPPQTALLDFVAPSGQVTRASVVEPSKTPSPAPSALKEPDAQPAGRAKPAPLQTAGASPDAEENSGAPQEIAAPVPEEPTERSAQSPPDRTMETSAQAGKPSTPGYHFVRPTGEYVKI